MYKKPFTSEELITKENLFANATDLELLGYWNDYKFLSANGAPEPGSGLAKVAEEAGIKSLPAMVDLCIMLITVIAIRWEKNLEGKGG